MIDSATIITALINTGGMGLVAGILLWLHISTLKETGRKLDSILQSFREEIREERRQCHEDHTNILQLLGFIGQKVDGISIQQKH